MRTEEIVNKLVDLGRRLRKALLAGEDNEVLYLLHILDSLTMELGRLAPEMALSDEALEKLRAFREFNAANGMLAARRAEEIRERLKAINPIYDRFGKIS